MTLFELIHKVAFDTIVPLLTAIDPENVPNNLYAFKEAFDELRRMKPGNAEGKQIVITTEVDTDVDGNVIKRYLHAGGLDGDSWETSLAKEIIFGSTIGEEKALSQILWQMTFRGFSMQEYPLESLPENEYERQAREFHRKGKIQRLIDRIMHSSPGYALCSENHNDGILTLNPSAEQVTPQRFRFLFDTFEISMIELYSRTVLKDGRAAYVSRNIADYYKAESKKFTKAIVLIETAEACPLRLSEFKPLQAALNRITSCCEHTCFLFGKNPDLGHDLHILIVLGH